MTPTPTATNQQRIVSHARASSAASEIDASRVAPFALRCGALLIDYTVSLAVLAATVIFARAAGVSRFGRGDDLIEAFGVVVTFTVTAFNFIVLAGFTKRTLGKWATGLHIERADGGRANFAQIFLRHVVGYPLSIMTFGLGFLLAAFGSRGRALHDYLAGTIVVRDTENRIGNRAQRTIRQSNEGSVQPR